MNILIPIVEMNEENMEFLEAKGIINRLLPGKYRMDVPCGESKHKSLYESNDQFGGHKIITVTINSTQLKNFVYHSDHEDFLLIDELDKTALILTICLLEKNTLKEKIRQKQLSSADFIALKCVFNDPRLSFFTLHKHFAHVETVQVESKIPPSFYVTESRLLDENRIDLGSYSLILDNNSII